LEKLNIIWDGFGGGQCSSTSFVVSQVSEQLTSLLQSLPQDPLINSKKDYEKFILIFPVLFSFFPHILK
jgi:hypothetical protein